MKRVLTYGTFDLLHVGHLNLLERLRALGDELFVGVSTDEFNELKGKQCVVSYEDRVRLIGALRCVTRTFPETSWSQKVEDIARFKITTFGMGDDWREKFDDLNAYCDVVYLSRTVGVSTTGIRTDILRFPVRTQS